MPRSPASASEHKHPDFISRQVGKSRYFFFDLNPSTIDNVTVICGGCEHCRPDYRVDREDFPYLSVEFVLSGRGTLVMGGEHELTAGSVFTYRPGIAHHIETAPRAPLWKYFVDFVGCGAEHLLAECGLSPGVVRRVANVHEVADIWEWLLREGRSDRPGSRNICASLLEVLLRKTAQNLLPTVRADAGASAAYATCRVRIEEQFMEFRSLEDIAAACHLDASYICRLFQRFDAQSPYHFLTRLQMNRAAEWLVGEGLLVKQAADRLGYNDPYHFSRVFKRIHGLPPSELARRSASI